MVPTSKKPKNLFFKYLEATKKSPKKTSEQYISIDNINSTSRCSQRTLLLDSARWKQMDMLMERHLVMEIR